MTLLSELFPDIANPVEVVFYKVPGSFTHTVPALSKWGRVTLRGCGGQGDLWGGGAAFVRTKFPVTPAEVLLIQVGTASTQSVAGDSFLKRNAGTVIAYADRGRGNMTRGLASNSTGDVNRDGVDGGVSAGGAPGSDAGDLMAILGAALGGDVSAISPGPGGGGRLRYLENEDGGLDRIASPAGAGIVCIEFFDGDPGV